MSIQKMYENYEIDRIAIYLNEQLLNGDPNYAAHKDRNLLLQLDSLTINGELINGFRSWLWYISFRRTI
jgi:hypothetical protein